MILLNGRIPQGGGRSLADADIPIVAVCEAIPGATIPQVEVQNREAARSAVAHLVELGHRRIAYLAGPSDNILEHERRAGFCLGLGDAGIPARQARLLFRRLHFAPALPRRSGSLAATASNSAVRGE